MNYMYQNIKLEYTLGSEYSPDEIDEQALASIEKIVSIGEFDFDALKFLLLVERVMKGSVEFQVNNIRFADQGDLFSVLLYAIHLLRCAVQNVIFEKPSIYSFQESSQVVNFTKEKNMTVLTLQRRGWIDDQDKSEEIVLNTTRINSMHLLKSVSQYYTDILTECFRMHPKLAESKVFRNHLPLSFCLN